jgi:predicted nucleotide-binding protein (sugar kinase/HSP70/actin superfamily)
MAYKVGIPRALLYYKYYPMWLTFLRELGADVVVSPPTTQTMIARGAARVVTDTCLPVKAFVGHVVSLVDECDFVFVPVLRSTAKKVLNCSRFLGLPDVTRAVIPEAPPILDIELDMNRSRNFLYRQIFRLGRHFTSNPLKIRNAARNAWQAHLKYHELMTTARLTYDNAIGILNDLPGTNGGNDEISEDEPVNIGLIGHPYVLNDTQINHMLLSRLQQQGVAYMTPEMLSGEQKKSGIRNIVDGEYWVSEEEVIGAGGCYIDGGVHGIIGAMAFGCGPDSLMMHLVERKARSLNIPFMCLTLEEHTAEAGIITRLEAFLDMIRRRHVRKDLNARNVSARR